MLLQMALCIVSSLSDRRSTSRLIFSPVILAYICVVRMLLWPSIFDTVSMGTSLARQMVVA